MHVRDMDYYVLELETADGKVELHLHFDAGWLEITSPYGAERIKLAPENAFALTYVLSKFIGRVLSEEEIRSLL
ncbi:hypothetical protein E3E25_03875 [Thermococcus sp. MAR1]|nr:hypothetical protein [Thermococcus sp. MAR1]